MSASRPMNRKKNPPAEIGALFMVLVLALASLGVAYGLWSKTLTIDASVNTGDVNAEFTEAFTDDDNLSNDPLLDSLDVGHCPLPSVDDDGDGEVDEDPFDDLDNDDDGQVDEDPPGKLTSCDPAEGGPDPKMRHDKDVGECLAKNADEDLEQVGNQNAEVEIIDGYPSYFCTAWFRVHNNGSIPVKVRRIDIADPEGNLIVEGVEPSVIYSLDLTGPDGEPDGLPDLDLHLTDIELKQQIDPSQVVLMDLEMHLKQGAPANSTFSFELLLQLAQWNEVE